MIKGVKGKAYKILEGFKDNITTRWTVYNNQGRRLLFGQYGHGRTDFFGGKILTKSILALHNNNYYGY